ncbi:hypothetical protein [Bacillus gaemokensis]|uniref:Large polyvalent protein associated domain-containing protein n=1 Tax=Bacillus gaemokensis TaxID=574375 RepID=A0A073K3I3_9BACI|nr:hypothetical protein [Bacillus gaemokensis]KEK21864.1 hypothetical protein BAGA_24665 [Bacillus gaemokensis]KYG37795.1 hypothetical protein AZF08_21940 [Bacillus gaemokensis]
MFVIFKSNGTEMESGRQYPFQEAYTLTKQLERNFREIGRKEQVDFTLLDRDSNEIYNGTLSLGLGYADHIFDHISKKMNVMELAPEQEEQKKELLATLEREINDSPFDEEEKVEVEPPEKREESFHHPPQEVKKTIKPEKGNRKGLKIVASVIGSVVLIGAGAIFAFQLFSSKPVSSVNAGSENYVVKGLQKAAIQQYGDAAQQFDKINYADLDKDSQKAVLFTYLLNGKANKALKYEPKFAESVVAYYIGIDNMKKINEIDVKNDVIDFEKAALNKKYKDVIRLKGKVNMDGRREKLVAEAFVNQKKFDDCFTFAKTQGNKTLMKEVKELQKKDVEQSTLSEEEKKKKIEGIDKDLKEL